MQLCRHCFTWMAARVRIYEYNSLWGFDCNLQHVFVIISLHFAFFFAYQDTAVVLEMISWCIFYRGIPSFSKTNNVLIVRRKCVLEWTTFPRRNSMKNWISVVSVSPPYFLVSVHCRMSIPIRPKNYLTWLRWVWNAKSWPVPCISMICVLLLRLPQPIGGGACRPFGHLCTTNK